MFTYVHPSFPIFISDFPAVFDTSGGGFCGPRSHWRLQGGVATDVGGGRAERCHPAGACKQAGPIPQNVATKMQQKQSLIFKNNMTSLRLSSMIYMFIPLQFKALQARQSIKSMQIATAAHIRMSTHLQSSMIPIFILYTHTNTI